MSRQSKNSKRRDRNRAVQIAQREARRSVAGRRYWHAGAPGLEPGTLLLNQVDAVHQGSDLTFYTDRPADDPTRSDRVYFTTDREPARPFAANKRIVDITTGIVSRHGDLYEIEPIGMVEPDPDVYRAASRPKVQICFERHSRRRRRPDADAGEVHISQQFRGFE